MPEITITLTDAQYKGLEYATRSPQEWVENATTERARIASDEIVNIYVKHCLDNGVRVPATRDEIVTAAFTDGVVRTAAEREAETVEPTP